MSDPNLILKDTGSVEQTNRLVCISVNKARLVLTRTLQLALSWNSPTFSYFFIFLTFFFTNEEKTKNPPGALETRDVALQDDHKKERKRRVQHRYTLLNENIILNFKTGRENSICICLCVCICHRRDISFLYCGAQYKPYFLDGHCHGYRTVAI